MRCCSRMCSGYHWFPGFCLTAVFSLDAVSRIGIIMLVLDAAYLFSLTNNSRLLQSRPICNTSTPVYPRHVNAEAYLRL